MPLDGTNFEQQAEVLDLLRRARGRVAHRWCQFTREDEQGGVCLLGALYGWDFVIDTPALQALFDEIIPRQRNCFQFISSALVSFNNESGRTQAEIVALFDRAIANHAMEVSDAT